MLFHATLDAHDLILEPRQSIYHHWYISIDKEGIISLYEFHDDSDDFIGNYKSVHEAVNHAKKYLL